MSRQREHRIDTQLGKVVRLLRLPSRSPYETGVTTGVARLDKNTFVSDRLDSLPEEATPKYGWVPIHVLRSMMFVNFVNHAVLLVLMFWFSALVGNVSDRELLA